MISTNRNAARYLCCRRCPPRGVTAIELATVTPLAFFFFFVAFEFCRVAMIRHSADNAVYEAARRVVSQAPRRDGFPTAGTDEAHQEVRRILAAVGIDHFTLDVQPGTSRPGASRPDIREVTVNVRIPLNDNSFVPPQFLGGRFIERELTLRREGI